MNLLNQELNNPAIYNSIIFAIATGSSQVSGIDSKTHINDTSLTVKYLANLCELGIIKREIPIMDKETSKKSIYRLADGMFRFWFRFVYKYISKIRLGQTDEVYAEIENQIPAFMGETFEMICKEYMMKAKLPFFASSVGRWWGNNPLKKCEQEIDLIATSSDEKKAIFCECKWRNEKLSLKVIDDLLEKAKMFNREEKYYFFFSKSGFTDDAKKRASDKIVLIDFKDMV